MAETVKKRKVKTSEQFHTTSAATPLVPNNEGLPAGWRWVKMGDVCEKITNGSSAKQYDEEVGLPISRIETIWNSGIDYARVKYVKENDEEFVAKYALKNNDILFSHINSDIHLGKTAVYKKLLNKNLIHGINILLIRANDLISADFLNYQLKFLRARGQFISIAQKSVNQSSINQAKLKNVDIVLPPISEQHAIVTKIEELLSELDKGKQQLETAQQQLKIYRQAVLKWAFEGKLTNENVKDGELPKGWAVVMLGEVSESCLGKMLDKQKNKGSLKPYLGNINVRWNSFDLNNLSEMPFEESESERFGILNGDLIICEGGEPGRAAIWKEQVADMKIQKALHRVRFKKSTKANYFLFYLNFIASSKLLAKYFTGTTIKHLTGQSLRKISFPLPSIKEQDSIVQEIESRLSVCDKVEETITTSLAQAETLRQSILKKAFEGKLV